MKIYTIATVPDKLVQKWLQHLRDFDQAHMEEGEDCHFEVAVDAPHLTLAEMVELIKVDPALTFQKLFTRPITTADDTN